MISFTDFQVQSICPPYLGMSGESIEQQLAHASALGIAADREQQQFGFVGDQTRKCVARLASVCLMISARYPSNFSS